MTWVGWPKLSLWTWVARASAVQRSTKWVKFPSHIGTDTYSVAEVWFSKMSSNQQCLVASRIIIFFLEYAQTCRYILDYNALHPTSTTTLTYKVDYSLWTHLVNAPKKGSKSPFFFERGSKSPINRPACLHTWPSVIILLMTWHIDFFFEKGVYPGLCIIYFHKKACICMRSTNWVGACLDYRSSF